MKRKITFLEFIIVIVLIVILVGVWNFTESLNPYSFILTWGKKGNGNGHFHSPRSIALDSKGNVYVADTKNNNIQKFNSNGEFLLNWGCKNKGIIESLYYTEEYYYVRDICLDREDNIYVAGFCKQIQKFDSNGNYLDMYGKHGRDDGCFTSAYVIAVDLKDNFFVGETMRVQKFDSQWNFIDTWKIWRTIPHQVLDYPVDEVAFYTDIEIDSQGFIYIVYTAFTEIPANLEENTYLILDANKYQQSIIYKVNPSGKVVAQWGNISEGKDSDLFGYVYGIAIDSKDRIFVADTGNNRILVLDNNGKLITSFGSKGYWNGYFRGPVDVEVDPEGNVYVVDYGNSRIQKFRPNSKFKMD